LYVGVVFRFILFLLVTYGDVNCVIGWRNGSSTRGEERDRRFCDDACRTKSARDRDWSGLQSNQPNEDINNIPFMHAKSIKDTFASFDGRRVFCG
jgi:hypothetical protein